MTTSGKSEEAQIRETYSALFLNTDAHKWDNVKSVFADSVNLDYSSLNGQSARVMSGDAIVDAWSAFLPKFNFTMHYLTNHVVSIQGNRAIASCYGHAIHHLKGAEGGDLWEVYGTYDFELEKINDVWKVTVFRYNHKYAAGNLNLPVIASQ